MVAQHYRWDFIGLSTDEKPTPQTSEKVVDGSTFYCSDNSKLYVFCGSQWYEKTVSGGGQYELPIASAETLGGVKVGSNLSIDAETGVLSATNTTYTAGSNVSISDENVISATDTTYSDFTGTDGTSAGTAGLVPAPATTDAGKFLKADGTWDTAGGGGVTPVQTTGTSTTDVMSQDAVTKMIYPDIVNYSGKFIIDASGTSEVTGNNVMSIGRNNKVTGGNSYSVAIGRNVQTDNSSVVIGGNAKSGQSSVVIGTNAKTNYNNCVVIGNDLQYIQSNDSVAIGYLAQVAGNSAGAIALGERANATKQGEMNIGCGGNTNIGYKNTAYRLISGVHDGEDLHDCATVAQANLLSTSAPTTSTVGVLGQLYTDTTNMHTYQCTAIDTVTDPDNPSYTWTQRW